MMFVLLLADMHVGSRWGIFPAHCHGSLDTDIQLNTSQQYLLACWERMVQEVSQHDKILLVLVGDIIDGQNLRQEGRFLCEPDPQFQARAARVLLAPLLERATKVYLTRGTPYHTGSAGQDEEFLGEIIGAEKGTDGRCVRGWLLLRIGNVLLDIAHRQSYSLRYRSTTLERELGFALERIGAGQDMIAKLCIVRAHTHIFRLVDDGSNLVISLPSWKLQDEYAQTSVAPNRTLPAWLGAVGLHFQGGEISNVIKYLFPHPRPTTVTIAGENSTGDSSPATYRTKETRNNDTRNSARTRNKRKKSARGA